MKTLQQIQTSAKNIHATVIEHKDMYFLNFSKEGTYEKAQQWGKDNDLLPSTKEDIESIRHDNLPLICGRYSGYVVKPLAIRSTAMPVPAMCGSMARGGSLASIGRATSVTTMIGLLFASL